MKIVIKRATATQKKKNKEEFQKAIKELRMELILRNERGRLSVTKNGTLKAHRVT